MTINDSIEIVDTPSTHHDYRRKRMLTLCFVPPVAVELHVPRFAVNAMNALFLLQYTIASGRVLQVVVKHLLILPECRFARVFATEKLSLILSWNDADVERIIVRGAPFYKDSLISAYLLLQGKRRGAIQS